MVHGFPRFIPTPILHCLTVALVAGAAFLVPGVAHAQEGGFFTRVLADDPIQESEQAQGVSDAASDVQGAFDEAIAGAQDAADAIADIDVDEASADGALPTTGGGSAVNAQAGNAVNLGWSAAGAGPEDANTPLSQDGEPLPTSIDEVSATWFTMAGLQFLLPNNDRLVYARDVAATGVYGDMTIRVVQAVNDYEAYGGQAALREVVSEAQSGLDATTSFEWEIGDEDTAVTGIYGFVSQVRGDDGAMSMVTYALIPSPVDNAVVGLVMTYPSGEDAPQIYQDLADAIMDSVWVDEQNHSDFFPGMAYLDGVRLCLVENMVESGDGYLVTYEDGSQLSLEYHQRAYVTADQISQIDDFASHAFPFDYDYNGRSTVGTARLTDASSGASFYAVAGILSSDGNEALEVDVFVPLSDGTVTLLCFVADDGSRQAMHDLGRILSTIELAEGGAPFELVEE